MPTLIFTASGTWTPPSDWPGFADKVECLGPGGSGAAGTTALSGGGGGGGEYAAATHVIISGNKSYTIGTAGSGTATNFPADTITITGHAGANASGVTAGSGGSGSTNTIHFNGGTGGAGSATLGRAGAGGGGAGGPLAAGLVGASAATTSGWKGSGGGADGSNTTQVAATAGTAASTGGAAGTPDGGAGGNGLAAAGTSTAGATSASALNWDATHGVSGGGGGGGGNSGGSGTRNGGAGGTGGPAAGYGGGGGGGGSGASAGGASGAARPGLIVVTYTSATLVESDTSIAVQVYPPPRHFVRLPGALYYRQQNAPPSAPPPSVTPTTGDAATLQVIAFPPPRHFVRLPGPLYYRQPARDLGVAPPPPQLGAVSTTASAQPLSIYATGGGIFGPVAAVGQAAPFGLQMALPSVAVAAGVGNFGGSHPLGTISTAASSGSITPQIGASPSLATVFTLGGAGSFSAPLVTPFLGVAATAAVEGLFAVAQTLGIVAATSAVQTLTATQATSTALGGAAVQSAITPLGFLAGLGMSTGTVLSAVASLINAPTLSPVGTTAGAGGGWSITDAVGLGIGSVVGQVIGLIQQPALPLISAASASQPFSAVTAVLVGLTPGTVTSAVNTFAVISLIAGGEYSRQILRHMQLRHNLAALGRLYYRIPTYDGPSVLSVALPPIAAIAAAAGFITGFLPSVAALAAVAVPSASLGAMALSTAALGVVGALRHDAPLLAIASIGAASQFPTAQGLQSAAATSQEGAFVLGRGLATIAASGVEGAFAAGLILSPVQAIALTSALDFGRSTAFGPASAFASAIPMSTPTLVMTPMASIAGLAQAASIGIGLLEGGLTPSSLVGQVAVLAAVEFAAFMSGVATGNARSFPGVGISPALGSAVSIGAEGRFGIPSPPLSRIAAIPVARDLVATMRLLQWVAATGGVNQLSWGNISSLFAVISAFASVEDMQVNVFTPVQPPTYWPVGKGRLIRGIAPVRTRLVRVR